MIVFLHPLAGGPEFWTGVRRLFGDHDTVAVDFAAAEPAGATLELADLTEHVAAELDRAENRDDVTLVGVSLGALVALDLVRRYPRRVRRLVLADGVPVYPDAMRDMWITRAASARRDGLADLLNPTLALWFSPSLLTAGGDTVESMTGTFLATDPQLYAAHCEILASVDLREAATRVDIPTLVVCGRYDAPPFVAAADWFAATIPDAELQWIDAGHHAAALEFPDAFAAALRRFLNRPRATR